MTSRQQSRREILKAGAVLTATASFPASIRFAAAQSRAGAAHPNAQIDAVLRRAVDVARSLAAMRSEAYRMAKRQMRRPALRRIEQDQPLLDPATVEVWASATTAAVIRSHLERVAARSEASA